MQPISNISDIIQKSFAIGRGFGIRGNVLKTEMKENYECKQQD